MRKYIVLLFISIVSVYAKADSFCTADSLSYHYPNEEIEELSPLSPTYLKGVVSTSSWRSNWFVSVSGGASAFVGNPKGCEDLFGRIRPSVNASLGKWFTPSVGWRIAYNGFSLTNSNLDRQSYYNLHSDILLNMINRTDDTRWKLVPYGGVGLINNNDSKAHPFAISYGLQGSYRLGNRFHIFAEFGGTATFSNFDGEGSPDKFGDHLLNLSAGISLTMGRSGWKRVVDASLYIRQNDILMSRSIVLAQRNRELLYRYRNNARLIAELTKILDLEGLLEKYRDAIDSADNDSMDDESDYFRNTYSGLMSLRDRLGRGNRLSGKSAIGHTSDRHLNGHECIGAPIHFFFIIGTTEFTDKSQMINVNEIARIAMEYNLSIRVIGAADSATGNEEINSTLADNRAKYIASLLVGRGVANDRIVTSSEGGINTYAPNEANRQVQVELY